jgi:hypothetical protein
MNLFHVPRIESRFQEAPLTRSGKPAGLPWVVPLGSDSSPNKDKSEWLRYSLMHRSKRARPSLAACQASWRGGKRSHGHKPHRKAHRSQEALAMRAAEPQTHHKAVSRWRTQYHVISSGYLMWCIQRPSLLSSASLSIFPSRYTDPTVLLKCVRPYLNRPPSAL